MNADPNAMPASDVDAPAAASARLSATRPFYWSVRRELWENRWIYLAPLAVGVLAVIGFTLSTVRVAARLRRAASIDPLQERELLQQPFAFAAVLLMATTFLVAIFYCLDALQGERRDRSIWFWKSLPVSDLTTVLAKASIPFVVLPVLTFAITAVAQAVILLLNSLVVLANGMSVAALWSESALLRHWFMLAYHLVTVHVLWYAPIYGWLLLVSAWSRRAAFLWAFLPLLAIAIVEKIAFDTSYVVSLLKDRMASGAEAVGVTVGSAPLHPMEHLTPGIFLTSPGLWLGLAFAAACLVGAARLRRSREPN